MNSAPRSGVRTVDFRLVLKWVLSILYIFLAGVFQTSFFDAAGLFPATPDLVLTGIAAIAIFCGEKIGSVCGLIAGILIISLGGSGTALFPLIYCLEGWLFGFIGKNGVKKNILSWSLYALPLVIFRSMISLVYIFSSEISLNLVKLFASLIFPEFIMTLIFSYIAFLIAYLIYRLTGDKNSAEQETQI